MLDTPLRMLLVAIAGWLNEGQRARIDFLEEQLRIFQEVHGRQPRLNDDQRRRLAEKGKRLGRSVLRELMTIVTPDTLLRWHRELIARKYDGSANRRPGRPRIVDESAWAGSYHWVSVTCAGRSMSSSSTTTLSGRTSDLGIS